jgi:hypothetical protein
MDRHSPRFARTAACADLDTYERTPRTFLPGRFSFFPSARRSDTLQGCVPLPGPHVPAYAIGQDHRSAGHDRNKPQAASRSANHRSTRSRICSGLLQFEPGTQQAKGAGQHRQNILPNDRLGAFTVTRQIRLDCRYCTRLQVIRLSRRDIGIHFKTHFCVPVGGPGRKEKEPQEPPTGVYCCAGREVKRWKSQRLRPWLPSRREECSPWRPLRSKLFTRPCRLETKR